MDNQFDNIPEEKEQEVQTYTDPNASYDQQNNAEYNYYQRNEQYSQNPYGQNNYNYNTGNNMEYNTNYNNMDTTPMSMGDWILTILALFIPCAGVIIYLVWAFGKKGNVNRRNYCRAYLIIYAVIMAIYLIVFLVFGAAIAGSM